MQWWETTIVIAAGVLTIFNLIDRIIGYLDKAKEPTSDLTKRIEAIEKKMENDYEERFKKDLQRIDTIEEGNRVTMKALLALLEHSIDGNNVEALKEAKDELTKHLINK